MDDKLEDVGCNGGCYEQSDPTSRKVGYIKTRDCDCRLIACPLCEDLHPRWIYDCFSEFCPECGPKLYDLQINGHLKQITKYKPKQ
ncbi:hypothetical protein PV-S19_0436 [Pacmanvirus S19]|nr:hypothetical protein PV-S19_0436 [Pacmanvirus S19]